MNKGWYVKVDTQVVFNVDTNIGVVAETEEQAGLEAQKIACEWFDRFEYKDVLEQALPWDIEMGGTIWHRGAATAAIDFDAMQAWSVTRDPDFDPDPEEIRHVGTVISVHTKDVLHIDVHRDLRSHASEKEAKEHLEYLKKEGLFDENLDAYDWHFVNELKEAVKEEVEDD
jgi:hypothetical protein